MAASNWAKLKPKEGINRKGKGFRYGPDHVDAGLEIMAKLREHAVSNNMLPSMVTTPAQVGPLPGPGPTHDGYCLGCKAKVTGVPTLTEKTVKNGSRHLSGNCPTCGGGVHAFSKKETD